MNRYDVARTLLEAGRLKDAELDVYLERALSIDYWKSLVPALSVDRVQSREPAVESALASGVLIGAVTRFKEDGYFQLPPLLSPSTRERMIGGVKTLIESGWPPVFGWIYDEFWSLERAAPLVELFATVVGEQYRQTPFVWTHVVSDRRGASGWPPHVDNSGTGFRLTVWIPLTDATLDTGCISVIPKHLEPSRDAGHWYEQPSLTMPEALGLLHASRALPALAGSVIGWDASVLHWGSARRTRGTPRISISMELVPATASRDALWGSVPASAGALPTFVERLRIVAAAINLYHHIDTSAVRYTTLADSVLSRVGTE